MTKRLLLPPLMLLGAACSDGGGAPEDPVVTRGKVVYQNVCIACHHGNPTQNGLLGPAIAGASRELVEAKVLRAEYPPGHTPTRDTSTMPRFEHLADEIGELVAYLASVAE